MRIACLWVPDFLLQALRRSAPELAEAPLGIAAGPLPRDVIVAVSAEAVELGVRPGMTAAQARQVAPAALVRVTPPPVAAAADEALADAAAGFSPRVKRHLPGEVLLDAGGLLPRFGREETIAHELLRACRHVGLEARVGIASNLGVARVAARVDEVAVVRAGEERSFMAPLPLELLQPAPELEAMLARWGLATAGELARLPRREVGLRLGPAGVALHRLASGEETGAFIPDPLQEVLREGVEFDDPLGLLEPFLFVANGILARLAQRLELRGEGFAEVLLELRLEGAGHREVRLKLVAPTRDVPAVLALARLQLEAHPPGAPVEGAAALVTPGRVRLAQGSLFGAPMPAPGRLSTTLARLAALVGPERVGAPAVPDTHRPGVWTLAPFVLGEDRGSWIVDRGSSRPPTGSASRTTNHEPRTTPHPVLRAFRPPREARVDAVNGRPVVVWVEALGGIVVGWAGPYRFVGEWWDDEPFAREDFDVATTDGSLLRVYFDRLDRRWFVDGIYD
ncbi:MAG: DNA polymerase Y family protein [Acidobacteriia bacterium]|nr:DNA polymerase Y family protein [Terriglobia bacterium]